MDPRFKQALSYAGRTEYFVMNVLHVSSFDQSGGAARAAYRLHQALVRNDVRSQMLVQSKSSDDHRVWGPKAKLSKGFSVMRPTLDLLPTLPYKNRSKTLFSPAWLPFGNAVDRINSLQPDVVHMHWVNGGMLPIRDIAKIRAPVVWSMHDMWLFTGGCHSDGNCGRFKEACGSCPVLGSDSEKDLSRRVWQRKQRVFSLKTDFKFVGVSRWLTSCARESNLLKGFDVTTIPNPIDTNVFSPVDKKLARELLGLPKGKDLILFGAMNALGDPNKGYQYLQKALASVRSSDVELVIFGSSGPEAGSPFDQPVHYMGYMHDDIALRLLYSAADTMIVPSIQEAFGQTASEAMACGTPVVAFGATGLLDIIDHKVNGYLATPYNAEDLARGIKWVLENNEANRLGADAALKVGRYFDYGVVAKQFIGLYQELL